MLNRRELLSCLDWFFSTEDALKTVQLLVVRGKTNLATYSELAGWAGDAESQLRRAVDADRDI